MNIQISVGMAPNPRTWPLFDGSAKADGIDLIMSPVHASELFWRQLRFGDFDLSDMSFSSLLIAIAHGDQRWVGLPIFTIFTLSILVLLLPFAVSVTLLVTPPKLTTTFLPLRTERSVNVNSRIWPPNPT